jgi:hypothetical protein
MKVGDLVSYKTHNGEWDHILGVVVRQIPGTDERRVIRWSTGDYVSYPKRQLKVVNESR